MSDSGSLTSGISGRYATALFELAREAGEIDSLEGDLNALESALNESDDLRQLIGSPVYTRDQQGRGMAAVAQKMGLSTLTANTLGLMAAKRRLFALPKLIKDVQRLVANHRGIVTAEVRAAKPLTDAQAQALAAALHEAAGREVKINSTVDESLIGGLVVKLGSRMIDTSVRAKLDSLKNVMKEVG